MKTRDCCPVGRYYRLALKQMGRDLAYVNKMLFTYQNDEYLCERLKTIRHGIEVEILGTDDDLAEHTCIVQPALALPKPGGA